MSRDHFGKFLAFLERLDQAEIPYHMEHSRDDAVMLIAFAPGEYWEIEFLNDGRVEIERFRSNGHIDDESVLEELFALCSDDPKPVQQTANSILSSAPRSGGGSQRSKSAKKVQQGRSGSMAQ